MCFDVLYIEKCQKESLSIFKGGMFALFKTISNLCTTKNLCKIFVTRLSRRLLNSKI